MKDLSPLENIGKPRETLKKEEVIDAPYNEKAAKQKAADLSHKDFISPKSLVRVYGYKHAKSLKFFGQLLLCLRDCYESKYE
jgi:hypothetical protein